MDVIPKFVLSFILIVDCCEIKVPKENGWQLIPVTCREKKSLIARARDDLLARGGSYKRTRRTSKATLKNFSFCFQRQSKFYEISILGDVSINMPWKCYCRWPIVTCLYHENTHQLLFVGRKRGGVRHSFCLTKIYALHAKYKNVWQLLVVIST